MISRRRALAGMAMATAFGPGRAFADKSCAVLDDQSTQLCTAGIHIGDVGTVRQRCDNWCWAACIEAIFALHGRGVSQERVAERLFGSAECQTASDEQIVATVNGSWTDDQGVEFTARAEQLAFAPMGINVVASNTDPSDATGLAIDMTSNLFAQDDLNVLISELENDNPLILGYAGPTIGHAVVLSAVSYAEYATGGIALVEFVVRDPWGESENRRVLAAEEIRNVFMVVKVTVES